MKRVLLILGLVMNSIAVSAQTFVVANDDGVNIKYSSWEENGENYAKVERNSYTGRVVVPASVVHEGVSYQVVGVANKAFLSSAAKYVHLPASVRSIGDLSFNNCNLDTLLLDAEVPVNFSTDVYNTFGYSYEGFETTRLRVPDGTLAAWKKTGWGSFKNIYSDAAYRLTVLPTLDSIVIVDDVTMPDGKKYNSNGYYEAGDTALLTVGVFSWRDSYVTLAKRGYFLGWSDGSIDRQHTYVMPQYDDTVYCIAAEMPYATLNANRISTPVYIFGNMSYDGQKANYQLDMGDYQAATIFSTSLWVGNMDHMAAGRFMIEGHDFYPGPLRTTDAKTDLFRAQEYNRVWHLTREMIDYHIAHCGEAGYMPADDILTWPANGDVSAGYAQHLAPFYDADNSGYYNPYAGDYPLIRGDECTFSIYNDACLHGESQGNALGIEIHCMTYAFDEHSDTALWNTVFVHYDIYNRSQNSYEDTYLGAWTDFDLGYAFDDYVGCDVKHGMYYAYNGEETDYHGTGSFLGVPPAQGCVILGGAMLPADGQDNPAITIGNPQAFAVGNMYGNMGINGMNFGDGIVDNERMGMTSFMYYNSGTNAISGDPQTGHDYYNYLHSYWKDGQHVKYGGNGISSGTDILNANFMFPGDSDPWYWGTDGEEPSVNPNDWTEVTAGHNHGDRRGVAGSGPFTFIPAAHEAFDVAYVTGFGTTDNASSVEKLRVLTDQVRRQFVRDTTDSGRSFVYSPYSTPHEAGIDDVQQALLQMYPNPTTGMLTVMVPMACEIQVYDMMGRQLLSQHVSEGKTTLDLGSLPQGIYLLRSAGHMNRVMKR